MATTDFIDTPAQQAPQSVRIQTGGVEKLGPVLASIEQMALAIGGQTDVVILGQTTDPEHLLLGVKHLARQVGMLASLCMENIGAPPSATVQEWLVPDAVHEPSSMRREPVAA